MEARGFGSGPRTALKSSPLRKSDWFLVGASAAAVTTFLASRATGGAADWYAYPALTTPAVDLASLAACLLLFAPVVAWRPAALRTPPTGTPAPKNRPCATADFCS